MCGRALKNYDKYLQKIELYAKASDIKIVYGEEDGEGSYSPQHRRIKIDTGLRQSHEIAVLLHELGHSMDDSLQHKFEESALSAAYGAMYSDRSSEEQNCLILKCEKRAWRMARGIAKLLRIPLGLGFFEAKNYCLQHYREF